MYIQNVPLASFTSCACLVSDLIASAVRSTSESIEPSSAWRVSERDRRRARARATPRERSEGGARQPSSATPLARARGAGLDAHVVLVRLGAHVFGHLVQAVDPALDGAEVRILLCGWGGGQHEVQRAREGPREYSPRNRASILSRVCAPECAGPKPGLQNFWQVTAPQLLHDIVPVFSNIEYGCAFAGAMPRNLLLLLPALAAGFRTVPSPSQRGQVRLMMAASELGKPAAGPATPPPAPPTRAASCARRRCRRRRRPRRRSARSRTRRACCSTWPSRRRPTRRSTRRRAPPSSRARPTRGRARARCSTCAPRSPRASSTRRVAFPEGVARGEVAALGVAGRRARARRARRRRRYAARARARCCRCWRAVRKRRRPRARADRALARAARGQGPVGARAARAGGETTTLGPVFSRASERAEDRWACAALCDVIESEIALRMLDERARTRRRCTTSRARTSPRRTSRSPRAPSASAPAHGAGEEAVLDKYVEEAAKRFRFSTARDALPAALGVLAVAWVVAAFEQVQQPRARSATRSFPREARSSLASERAAAPRARALVARRVPAPGSPALQHPLLASFNLAARFAKRADARSSQPQGLLPPGRRRPPPTHRAFLHQGGPVPVLDDTVLGYRELVEVERARAPASRPRAAAALAPSAASPSAARARRAARTRGPRPCGARRSGAPSSLASDRRGARGRSPAPRSRARAAARAGRRAARR